LYALPFASCVMSALAYWSMSTPCCMYSTASQTSGPFCVACFK
jgi:hypothetical protein